MAMTVRSLDVRANQATEDRYGITLIEPDGNTLLQQNELGLKVCEQIRPVRRWVIVACRSGGRITQLSGVFMGQKFAEAEALKLAARWMCKSRRHHASKPAPPIDSRSSHHR